MNMEKEIFLVHVDDIIPNRFQPREIFDEKALIELSESIKEHGIIQPLVVRKIGDKYEIIAGERRYKASLLAGLNKIPVIIADLDDQKSAEVALAENIQRRDLTPIEEAKTYQRILKLGNLTQDELAKRMGKNQSTVANKLRLLGLDETIQNALLENKISERHARALLNLESKEEQKELLDRIINTKMTVRDTDLEIKNKTGKNFIAETDDANVEIIGDSSSNNVDNLSIVTDPINNESIDKIKEIAVDLNQLDAMPNNGDILKPEEVTQTLENDNMTTRVELPSQTEETIIPNKFFMPLEEEEANMEMEEQAVSPLDISTDENKDIEPLTNQIVEPIEIDNIQTEELSASTPIEKKVEETNNMPTYTPPKIFATGDLRTAINTIRQCVDTIEKYGFTVDSEEFDFEDIYQVIIKINK